MDFLIINGKVVSKDEANLTEFLWGEPFILSQKIWFGYGGIPLFNENLDSIKQQLKTLGQPLPDLFKNKRELFRLTKRMLNKNKFYRSGFINYQFFISQNQVQSLITSSAFSEFEFPFTTQGMLVQLSDFTKSSSSVLGQFKCHNQYLWQSAKAQIKNTINQSAIILNEKMMICEGISSNIFLIKNNALITPSLETGCYNDALRTIVLERAKFLKLKVIETSTIEKEHLMEMDEVFFVSEEFGVQWVLGIETKRFVHRFADEMHEQLNAFLKSKVI
jgi:branched-chain amino acid aminotransferase